MTATHPIPASQPGRLVAAFLRRDFAVSWSYRLPFVAGLFQSFIGLILFFFIAKLVDPSATTDTAELGQGYFAFVVTGFALVAIVQTAMTEFSTSIVRAQNTGTLEALAASPTPLWQSTLLGSTYPLLYATVAAVINVSIAVAMFDVRFDATLAAIPAVILGTIASLILFAGLGMALAAFAIVFKRVGPLSSVFSTALAFLGGVWFPIDLLPRPFELLANILPFTWAVDVVRQSLLAGEVPVDRLVLLGVFALVLLPICCWVFHMSAQHARRRGTLSHY